MQNFRALGVPPPDPRASGGWGFAPKPPVSGGWGLQPQTPIGYLPQNSPHPIADFWLRACYVLFIYVTVELSTFIKLI